MTTVARLLTMKDTVITDHPKNTLHVTVMNVIDHPHDMIMTTTTITKTDQTTIYVALHVEKLIGRSIKISINYMMAIQTNVSSVGLHSIRTEAHENTPSNTI